MDDAQLLSMLNMWPVPVVLIDPRSGQTRYVNDLAAQAGFRNSVALKDIFIQPSDAEGWLSVRNNPKTLRTAVSLAGSVQWVTAAIKSISVGHDDTLLAVLTEIVEPSDMDDDAAVVEVCETFACGQTNALKTFLQASALTLGAFCAAVYEKKKDRYIIREEWRGRRSVSISILSADFDIHPEQEMARIGGLKRAQGVGFAPFIKRYGTQGVLVYFFDFPAEPTLEPRIERFARLLRALAPDTVRHGNAAVIRQGLDTLQQGIAIWDKSSGKLIYENKAYHALFGGSVPFKQRKRGIGPDSHKGEDGRHYSLTHAVGRLGRQWLVTTHVADITRWKLTEHKLAMAAKTDPLTGLFNRRAGLEILAEVYARCRKNGQALTVGFADIDGLKAVNDTFGHGAGDSLIRAVADLLKKYAGREGTVCRLGGDEFVLILPGMNKVQAQRLADGIKCAVAKCFVGNSRSISISFGFKQAEYKMDETPASLVSVADTDMYRDKRANRSAE